MHGMDQLLQVGAVGGVLIWFLARAEPRLKGLEESNDRMTRGMMLFVLAAEEIRAYLRDQAAQLLAETEAAEKHRK
jgi:hypothetical protein